MSSKDIDIVVNQFKYPNAEDIFGLALSSLDDIKGNCKIVLDTNTLLVPYLTGSDSLKIIRQIFEKLKGEHILSTKP